MPNLTLTVAPTNPGRGDTVTATYAVTGNDAAPAGTPTRHTITGQVTFDGVTATAETTITLPGSVAVPPAVEVYSAPTCDGLTFMDTPDVHVWTAVVT